MTKDKALYCEEGAIYPVSNMTAKRLDSAIRRKLSESVDCPICWNGADPTCAFHGMKMEWMAIDTAPRDGRDILVCNEGTDGVDMVSWKGGSKKGGWATEDRTAIYTGDGFFTHWMPLPIPPKAPE